MSSEKVKILEDVLRSLFAPEEKSTMSLASTWEAAPEPPQLKPLSRLDENIVSELSLSSIYLIFRLTSLFVRRRRLLFYSRKNSELSFEKVRSQA